MTEQTIQEIAKLYIADHSIKQSSMPETSPKTIETLNSRKCEMFEDTLRWLLERFVIIGRKKMESIIGGLNGCYDNGNDELVGIYIGELAKLIEESDE